MIIAAQITSNPNAYSFLAEQISLLAKTHAEHQFILFTELVTAITKGEDNITQIIITPKIKNSLLLHYWHNYKLPYLLKKYKANIFISENTILSLNTLVPQMMIIDDISTLKKSGSFRHKYARYLHKNLSKFLKRANLIITTDKYLEEILKKKYPDFSDKISSIYPNLANNYMPISWQQKESIISTYTDDRDYFIYPVTLHTKQNIITALKAFSIFKKWQKSSMKLVFLLKNVSKENLVKDFHLYRYKDDVKMIDAENNEAFKQLISAAYALIYLPQNENIEYFTLNAMQCEVPVITTHTDLNKSIFANAVLYNAVNEKALAENMALVYKDEIIRNNQIKKALLLTAKYDGLQAQSEFWQAIIKTNEP
jgi:glycosyltransferase involved in cell wall biosynthesis